MAIVKQLTELHGGTVRARPWRRPRVHLRGEPAHHDCARRHVLARQGRTEGGTKKDEFDYSATPLSGIKVLVVDDEPDARRLIRRVLMECGAEVATCWGRQTKPDADRELWARASQMVSDVGMPDQDGYDPNPSSPGPRFPSRDAT